MPPTPLHAVTATYGHTAALRDGRIAPAGFDLRFTEYPVIVQAFRRMVRNLEFDVCEMAITTYLCAREHGVAFTALPLFVMRGFHHGAIVRHRGSGITGPKDLEGRRVGVNRGYTVTTGVWVRGILQDEYGVDLDRVTWVLSGDEHVQSYRPPANVVPMPEGGNLADLLRAGEIDAAIGIEADGQDVVPLIEHPDEAAHDALRSRGLYPINHLVVVRDEVLAAHPELPAALFAAYAEAKRGYLAELSAGTIAEPTAHDKRYRRVLDLLGGDPLPYGIAPNHAMIELLISHATRQRIVTRPVQPADVFATATHDLAG